MRDNIQTPDPGQGGLTIGMLNMNGGATTQTNEKWNHMNQIMWDNKIGVLAVQVLRLDSDLPFSSGKRARSGSTRPLCISSRNFFFLTKFLFKIR
jgi:hypothetical protein